MNPNPGPLQLYVSVLIERKGTDIIGRRKLNFFYYSNRFRNSTERSRRPVSENDIQPCAGNAMMAYYRSTDPFSRQGNNVELLQPRGWIL